MKVVLSIAGSDSGGGAGIQADLKTFEAFGLFGTTVLSVLTAQNTQGVSEIYEISPSFVEAQIRSVFEDFEVSAIKIGMLYSNEIIDVVKKMIKNLNIPIVIDPVFISKSQDMLLNKEAISNLKSLFEYATVVTPNRFEAHELFGYKFGDSDSLKEIIHTSYPILIKNEILEMNNHLRSVDMLYRKRDKRNFSTPYRETKNTHGTGCSFSSAICANLALGKSLDDSIEIAKKFIYLAIKNAPNIGKGKVSPINHKVGGEICQLQANP